MTIFSVYRCCTHHRHKLRANTPGMRGLYHPAVNQEVEGPTHCGIPISTHDKSCAQPLLSHASTRGHQTDSRTGLMTTLSGRADLAHSAQFESTTSSPTLPQVGTSNLESRWRQILQNPETYPSSPARSTSAWAAAAASRMISSSPGTSRSCIRILPWQRTVLTAPPLQA